MGLHVPLLVQGQPQAQFFPYRPLGHTSLQSEPLNPGRQSHWPETW